MSTHDKQSCPTCFGTGRFPIVRPVHQYQKLEPLPVCSNCGGSGRLPPKPTKPRGVPIKSKITEARRTRRG